MFSDHSKENPSVFQTFRQTLSLFPFHQLLPSLSYIGLKERAHIPFVAESYQIKDEKGVKGQFKPLCIASPTISFSFNVRFHKQTINKHMLYLPSQLYFIPNHKLVLVFRKPAKCLPGYH